MPNVEVRQAVSAVRAFISDLFGEAQLRYVALEEVEYDEERDMWAVTMSFGSPTSVIVKPDQRELKQFQVDGTSGQVLSMKIKKS